MRFKIGDRVVSRFNGTRYKIVASVEEGALFLEVIGYKKQPDIEVPRSFPRAWVRYIPEYDVLLEVLA